MVRSINAHTHARESFMELEELSEQIGVCIRSEWNPEYDVTQACCTRRAKIRTRQAVGCAREGLKRRERETTPV